MILLHYQREIVISGEWDGDERFTKVSNHPKNLTPPLSLIPPSARGEGPRQKILKIYQIFRVEGVRLFNHFLVNYPRKQKFTLPPMK